MYVRTPVLFAVAGWLALVLATAGCASGGKSDLPHDVSDLSGVPLDLVDATLDSVSGPADLDQSGEATVSPSDAADLAGELPDLLDVPPDQVGSDPCDNLSLPPGVTREGDRFQVTCGDTALFIEPVSPGIMRVNHVVSQSPTLPYAMQGFVPDPPEFGWGSQGDVFFLCAPELRVQLDLATCRTSVFDSDQNVLYQEVDDGAVTAAQMAFEETSHPARRLRLASPEDEVIYGLGEKTGPLNKRGHTYRFWNSDTPGYPVDHDPLYQSVPFFIGLRDGRAYGWFLNNTWPSSIDVADTTTNRLSVVAMDGNLDQYIIAGPAIKTVLERYAVLTGKAPMPPRWTLGYHQARWSYYPDSKVLEIADGFRQRGIPADAIWLDIDYMDGFRSFTWDPVGFSDPAGLTSQLADEGFKTVVIIDPGLKSDPDWDIYQQGVAGDHFLMADGEPFVGEVWPGAAVFPDFTRPETRSWWGGLFSALTEVGVLGVWLDMNEPANFRSDQFHTVPSYVDATGDGGVMSMAGVHNTYALAEALASYDGLLAAEPDRRPFLLTRAGFAGIQKAAAIWTGDAASTMPALKATFTMLLGMGLSGLPFVGSDCGGWTGSPTPELFARWIEVGSISPFFRTHVATDTPDQEPWSFTLEVEDISRIHINERYRLLPYYYSLFRTAHESGIPLLRAMPLEFQDDAQTYNLSHQAMVGPWLLAAPVLDEGATERTVYLPDGDWLEWHSGARHTGPGFVTTNLTLQALPLYLRAGAIVPTAPVMQFSDQAPLSPLSFELHPGDNPSEFVYYEDDGESRGHLDGEFSRVVMGLAKSEAGATFWAEERTGTYVPPQRPVKLRFRPVDGAVSGVTVDGLSLPEFDSAEVLDSAVEGYYHDANDRSLWAKFADRNGYQVTADYDVALAPEAENVLVTLRVSVPDSTPLDSTVHVATSAAGWAQQAMSWSGTPGVAEAQVSVPRGEWFEYKYTRGDWDSVEKWDACMEADNRYHFGKALPVKEDSVTVWADMCL